MSAAGKKKKKKADEEAAEVSSYSLQQNSYLMASVTFVFMSSDCSGGEWERGAHLRDGSVRGGRHEQRLPHLPQRPGMFM